MYISCCHQRKGLITACETVIDKGIKVKFIKKTNKNKNKKINS